MTTPEERAEAIFAAVSAGQTIFFKAGDQWRIIGPADVITSHYQRVEVTKKDGSTVEVSTTSLDPVREVRGLRYRAASFRRVSDLEQQHVTRSSPRRYATVPNAAFGPGRRYTDQPGATQYDDGSGCYNIQIWDES